jgi:major membrane immunogen (membrane-anchored lipoprotein)
MKKLKIVVTILLLSIITGGMSSCLVTRHSDNGRHKGWYKNHDNRRHKKVKVYRIGHENRNKPIFHNNKNKKNR